MIVGEQNALRVSIHGMLAGLVAALLVLSVAMVSGIIQGAISGAPGGSRVQAPGGLAGGRAAPVPPPGRAGHKGRGSREGAPGRSHASFSPSAPHGLFPPAANGAGRGARLAIVIDDLGHNLPVLNRLLRMNRPLTFAVLPSIDHTREAARLIESAGWEFIIHLPMEPFAYPGKDPGPRALLLSQSQNETARRVRGYMDQLPGASGASNHMGSAYTHDSLRMGVVQTVLAERKLYFLNSRTSGASTPREIAERWGYRYLERDVFLDHDPAEPAIERSFNEAVRQAKARGHAIAIGHPYPETLRVLERYLPRLAGQGVSLVTLSSLLEDRAARRP